MKFENTFAVRAPADEVWKTMMDVERVAPCMPGAEVLEHLGDDSYKVGIKVKLGPISMLYRGQVEIVERDDPSWHATMRAKAKEARGQGTADASVQMSLAEEADGTHATITTEMQLSGKAAAMGQGVIGDVAQRLVEEFASNLARLLEARNGGPAAPQPAAVPEPRGAADTSAAQATLVSEAPPRPTPKAAPPPPPPLPPESALPVGKIAAGVISGRLSDPRTLLITAATFAAVCGAIGYVIGRSR